MKLHTSDLCEQPAYWLLTIAGNENYTQVVVWAVKPTDAQNFVSLFLIYPDNLINLPNGGILSL